MGEGWGGGEYREGEGEREEVSTANEGRSLAEEEEARA